MPRSPEQRWRRALAYLAEDQVAPASAQLDALQATAPAHVCTALLAAEIAWREDRIRDASRFALQAAGAEPAGAEVTCDVVSALLRVGDVAAARRCLARTAWLDAAPAMCLMRVADFRLALGEYAESLALLERVIAAGNDVSVVHFYRGRLLSFMGRLGEAEAEYLRSLRQAPGYGAVALQLVTLRTQTPGHNHLNLLETGIRSVARGSHAYAAFEFARYHALEDLGRYEAAWQALADANATLHALTHEYAWRQDMFLQRSLQYYATHALPAAGKAVDDGPQPIFIVGLPRSGTTVLERLLGNHSEVTAAGELFDFGRQLQWMADHRSLQDETFLQRLERMDLAETGRRYLAETQWRAHGKRYFVDKQTSNWMVAGLVHAALPGARILHLVREPMDVCFSIFRAMFGDAYAIGNDLPTLAAHHQRYRRLMERWRVLAPGSILDVSYADLVSAPEATLRKVLAHCGLPWEPACADLAANTSPESTLSAAQIRQPLHTRASGKWRHYAAHLTDLSAALSDP